MFRKHGTHLSPSCNAMGRSRRYGHCKLHILELSPHLMGFQRQVMVYELVSYYKNHKQVITLVINSLYVTSAHYAYTTIAGPRETDFVKTK